MKGDIVLDPFMGSETTAGGYCWFEKELDEL